MRVFTKNIVGGMRTAIAVYILTLRDIYSTLDFITTRTQKSFNKQFTCFT